MKKITLELVRDKWRACYDKDRLARLYDRPMTAFEVLTRKDGEWADVPDKDRLWTVLRHECMTERELRLVACFAADYAMQNKRNKGREPDQRSLKAVEVSRRYADGEATAEELTAARDEAWEAYTTTYAAVRTAAAAEAAWAATRVAAADAEARLAAARVAATEAYAAARAVLGAAADAAIVQFAIDLLKDKQELYV